MDRRAPGDRRDRLLGPAEIADFEYGFVKVHAAGLGDFEPPRSAAGTMLPVDFVRLAAVVEPETQRFLANHLLAL